MKRHNINYILYMSVGYNGLISYIREDNVVILVQSYLLTILTFGSTKLNEWILYTSTIICLQMRVMNESESVPSVSSKPVESIDLSNTTSLMHVTTHSRLRPLYIYMIEIETKMYELWRTTRGLYHDRQSKVLLRRPQKCGLILLSVTHVLNSVQCSHLIHC